MSVETNPRAVHLPGGNLLDDVRIDIDASFAPLMAWNATRPKSAPPRRSALRDRVRHFSSRALERFNLGEFVVGTGLSRAWFEEFLSYWFKVLRGRPITVQDFMLLLYDYRKRIQHAGAMQWDTSAQHVANWQDPAQLFYVFHFCRKAAINPIRIANLDRLLKPGARALEYGCSLAPVFRDYRRHYRHLACRWVLADIPNFPFHYAMYSYAADADVEAMPLITPDRFRDPLAGIEGGFDLIVVQEVFEHLDDPLFVADYLIERLNPGGRLVFDYVRSDGEGLDTPYARDKRQDALKLLSERLVIEQGRFAIDGADVGQCIGRKR